MSIINTRSILNKCIYIMTGKTIEEVTLRTTLNGNESVPFQEGSVYGRFKISQLLRPEQVVNALNSDLTNVPLSAAQGKALNAMVNSLGAGYQYAGVATPATNPGTPDAKVFYLASTPGTYTYLGGLVVADGEVALLKYDSSWTKEVTGIASADKLSQLGQEKIDILPGYNLFNKNELYPGSFLSDGSLYTGSTSHRHTSKIRVNASSNYCYSLPNGSLQTSARYTVFYKEDGSLCSTPSAIGTSDSSQVITTPADCAYLALSVIMTDANVAKAMFNAGDSRPNEFVPFNPIGGYSLEKDAVETNNLKDGAVSSPKIADGAVTTPKIADGAVQEKSTSFFLSGINLLNKDASDIEEGYINAQGVVTPSSSYITTGFIEIDPASVYCLVASMYRAARWVCCFDEGKNVVGSLLTNVQFITTPAAAKYIRITYASAYWNDDATQFQVVKSLTLLPYIPFGQKFKDAYMLRKALFFLPKDIYVADGRTIEIYYNQVLLGAEQYVIRAVCARGKALTRKFQFIGSSSVRGDWYLTLYAYDLSENLIAVGRTTIHCVPATISASKNILCIGDSLTNGKFWLQEIRALSSEMLNCVGTRTTRSVGTTDTSIRHEGRSGGDCQFYNDGTGTRLYSYDGNYAGEGKDEATVFDETASYSVDDYVKVPKTFEAGAGYVYYKYKVAHTPGAFVPSECINLSETNPLWDYRNGGISYNFYKSRNGVSADMIVIWLGTNGINLEPKTNVDGALGIKTLVDNIREEDTTTPIIIVNTIFRGTQNGIGNQSNTDGYISQSSYKHQEDKKVMLLSQAVDEMLLDYENVFFCPASVTMDSEYDYGVQKYPVNPRLTDTDTVFEIMPYEATHPQKVGYEQVADELFSVICHILNS